MCELRREHPGWGAHRIAHELGRLARPDIAVPSRNSVHPILVRNGLIDPRRCKRRREGYIRWEREAPMALWQLDIVGGVFLVDGTECKVVTGVDDHSRFGSGRLGGAAGDGAGGVSGVRRSDAPLRPAR